MKDPRMMHDLSQPEKPAVTSYENCVFCNAILVLGSETMRGSLKVQEGRIADIAPGGTVTAGAIDCGGDLLAPGLIELHTDNLERHMVPRPGVNWPHRAAIVAHDAELASVGITTVFDAMRVGSIPQSKSRYHRYARGMASEILELRETDALKISHFLHLRAEICSETLIDELNEFGPEDRVGIVSLMDHAPGQRQFRDLSKLRRHVVGKQGLSEQEFIDHVANLHRLHDAHSAEHEAAVVAHAARYGAVLASHDDTTADHVAVSRGYGIRLAEFPTTREAAAACNAAGIAVMMGAPNLIRGGSHSGNVAAAELAEAGLLDILSSDYVPSALLTGAIRLGQIVGNTARGLAAVTAAPAAAAGLTDRGHIDIGARADLVRVAMIDDIPVVRASYVQGRRIA